MSVNMHVREVPDHIHDELQRRAAASGMTLRTYTVKVLEEHCSVSPMAEWLERVARRRARWLAEGRTVAIDAAAVVAASRADDDDAVIPADRTAGRARG
jgi:plasmid stability protein